MSLSLGIYHTNSGNIAEVLAISPDGDLFGVIRSPHGDYLERWNANGICLHLDGGSCNPNYEDNLVDTSAILRTAADTIEANPDRWVRGLVFAKHKDANNTATDEADYSSEATCACAIGHIAMAARPNANIPYDEAYRIVKNLKLPVPNFDIANFNDLKAASASEVANFIRKLAE